MNKVDLRTKSFETMAAAAEFARHIMRAADTKRVQIAVIIDDRTRNEAGAVEFSQESVS